MGVQAAWRYGLAGCLAWLAVVSAVAVGGHTPAESVWGPTPTSPRFDTARIPPGSLVPLDPTLVARLLGTTSAVAAAALGEPRGMTQAGLVAPSASAAAGRGRDRVVVAHDLTNDDRATPYVIRSIPFTARTDTRPAGREGGEPRDCAGDGGTVWYSYTPARDRTLLVSTAGTDYAAALAVFDDSRTVGCDVDPSGDAKVTFAAKAGRRYLFQVSGPLGGGALTFNVDALDAVSRLAEHAPIWSYGGPSMSADATRIVYLSSAGLRLYETKTGAARAVLRAWDGGALDGDVAHARLSADGQWIVFASRATNLVPGDTNLEEDVFVHHIDTGRTTRVSVTSAGHEGRPNSPQAPPEADVRVLHQAQVISSDGRFVAFSSALQLDGPLPSCSVLGAHLTMPYEPSLPRLVVPVGARTYDCRALYVHDRMDGSTTRVHLDRVGAVNVGGIAMSPDARYIVFTADVSTAGHRNVFVHDRHSGGVELVSVAANGGAANGHSTASHFPRGLAISADGRLVAFTSLASNLVPGDLNGRADVFVRDRASRTTTSLSQQLGPLPEADTETWAATVSMSADGRLVAYDTPASDAADAASYVPSCNVDNTPLRLVRVHDTVRRTSVVLPVAPDGARANGGSFGPELSATGDALALSSWATNLDTTQQAPCPDVKVETGDAVWLFLIDRDTRQ